MRKKDFKRFLQKYQSNQLNEAGTRFMEAWYDSLNVSTGDDPLQNEEKAASIKNAMHVHVMKHVQAVPKIRSIGRWYYAAACLFVLVCAVYIIQRSIHAPVAAPVYTAIKVPPGQLKKIILPDSSVVWLNAGTEIRYHAQTFNQQREFYLDEGEAFFTVVRDPRHPFTVHASHLSTNVLGTSFNVKAYLALEYASVQVKTGKVLVRNITQHTDTIAAQQSITYNKITGSTTLNTQEKIDRASWMDGVTVLQEAGFEELKLVLYNRYKVRLMANDPAIHQYRYSMLIQQQRSVDEIMKAICAIHQNKFKRSNDTIIIY